jgi:hypothetical protein
MYWGYRGRVLSSEDAVWCDRLVWMALTETVKGGALVYLPEQRRYQCGPRLDVAIKAIRRCSDIKAGGDPLVSLAMCVCMREAALNLYAFQRPVEAEEALRQLKKEKASDVTEDTTLEVFIQKEITARMNGLDNANKEKQVLNQLVRSDIWRRLETPDFAAGYERLARLYWTSYAGTTGTDKAWQSLQKRAQERSLLEMPAVVQP